MVTNPKKSLIIIDGEQTVSLGCQWWASLRVLIGPRLFLDGYIKSKFRILILTRLIDYPVYTVPRAFSLKVKALVTRLQTEISTLWILVIIILTTLSDWMRLEY